MSALPRTSLRVLSLASGFVALSLLLLAGLTYRLHLLELGQAFGLLRWAVYIGLASVILVVAYGLWQRPKGLTRLTLIASALAGVLAVYVPASQMLKARSVPPIHDITTDLQNPPAFADIIPLRREAPNPPEYAGPETARLQREAYPDIQPLIIDAPLTEAYEAARSAARRMGWEFVSAGREGETARIEATATTFWFGFKDDVVVRIRPSDEGTRVDVRSKSRVGKGDLGTNAERIRAFLTELQQQL